MSQFKEFKEIFDKNFKTIGDFIDKTEYKPTEVPFTYELKENNDIDLDDSYGESQGKTLERVFYFSKYEVYVKFNGEYSSYNGEEWNSMKEVIPTEKKQTIYQEVK